MEDKKQPSRKPEGGAAVRVSVCVAAYNHAGTVAQTLGSVLSQETSFGFEVIVRDDASTDGTADVLRDFGRRHPGKVRLVLEGRNRWNDPDAKPVFGRVFAPLARGDYLATCEGDDYWSDPRKLQRQFDYMEAHPACSACCHAVSVVRADGRATGGLLSCGGGERDITCDEVMEMWGRTTDAGIWTLHPSSSFTRRSAELEYASAWRLPATAGDFVRMCYHAHSAPVHYLPQPMSAYRYLSEGSWTNEAEGDASVLAAHYREFIETMERIDELTGLAHHDAAMRGCVQRALLLAGMTDGASFFKRGIGKPIAPYLTAGDRATLAALRLLNAAGLRPARDTASGKVRPVRKR